MQMLPAALKWSRLQKVNANETFLVLLIARTVAPSLWSERKMQRRMTHRMVRPHRCQEAKSTAFLNKLQLHCSEPCGSCYSVLLSSWSGILCECSSRTSRGMTARRTAVCNAKCTLSSSTCNVGYILCAANQPQVLTPPRRHMTALHHTLPTHTFSPQPSQGSIKARLTAPKKFV